jgi:hypothetical protein
MRISVPLSYKRTSDVGCPEDWVHRSHATGFLTRVGSACAGRAASGRAPSGRARLVRRDGPALIRSGTVVRRRTPSRVPGIRLAAGTSHSGRHSQCCSGFPGDINRRATGTERTPSARAGTESRSRKARHRCPPNAQSIRFSTAGNRTSSRTAVTIRIQRYRHHPVPPDRPPSPFDAAKAMNPRSGGWQEGKPTLVSTRLVRPPVIDIGDTGADPLSRAGHESGTRCWGESVDAPIRGRAIFPVRIRQLTR